VGVEERIGVWACGRVGVWALSLFVLVLSLRVGKASRLISLPRKRVYLGTRVLTRPTLKGTGVPRGGFWPCRRTPHDAGEE
jgi:hypothetical protein